MIEESAKPSERLLVVITTAIGHKNLDRFLPGRIPKWSNCDFLINPPSGTECDFWIVFAACRDGDSMRVAPENTLFIAGEPPSKKIYPKAYYSQFHTIVSCHADDPHPRVITSAPGLPWHVGLDHSTDEYIYGYDELSKLERPEKAPKISVICSNLTTTEGQRLRLKFLEQLKEEMPDQVIHYGRGFTPIDDKMDAILPNQYHLVLENSHTTDYWTEKLADAYLGWAHPIYAGCPNIGEYFPETGFTPIDITNPRESIDRIKLTLKKEFDYDIIRECREKMLNVYNPFARFAYWTERLHKANAAKVPVKATTHRAFRPFPRNLIYHIKSHFSR
ncbi:MAG: glycosyltransferase family 10 domain-containing protein [Luteolibacter sp.]